MDIYEALYTTRAMRRVRPDPIPLDVQAKILDAAIRAPRGGNSQNWRFLLVDDPGVGGADRAAVPGSHRPALGRRSTPTAWRPPGHDPEDEPEHRRC